MFEVFLPFLLGLIVGISPSDPPAQGIATATPEVPRPVEDQTATGQFTTAAEVKPILEATKGNWVAIRNYEGQDLVYFTHLMSWRCGLWEVRYGLNGAAPDTLLEMEPCHIGTATPNAMTAVDEVLPYISQPADSIDSINVAVSYDDGTADMASFSRAEVLIP